MPPAPSEATKAEAKAWAAAFVEAAALVLKLAAEADASGDEPDGGNADGAQATAVALLRRLTRQRTLQALSRAR